MGSYLHTYLGPYVSYKFRNETRPIQVFGCTNKKCSEYARRSEHRGSVKFCFQCASPIGESEKIVPYHPYYGDVLDKFGETLTSLESVSESKEEFLGSNQKGLRHFWPENGGCNLDLSTLDIKAEIAEFEQSFAGELQALREVYDDVQVRWGLHLFYH